MRKRGDRLLPVPCTKSTALQLVGDALAKRCLTTGKQLAEETLEQHYLLSRVEKMLICTMIYAASEPRYAIPGTGVRNAVDDLWEEAIKDLPPSYYDDVADMLIHLAEIFAEQGDEKRAWYALHSAEQYTTSQATRLRYAEAKEAYEALKKPQRIATIIDLRM